MLTHFDLNVFDDSDWVSSVWIWNEDSLCCLSLIWNWVRCMLHHHQEFSLNPFVRCGFDERLRERAPGKSLRDNFRALSSFLRLSTIFYFENFWHICYQVAHLFKSSVWLKKLSQSLRPRAHSLKYCIWGFRVYESNQTRLSFRINFFLPSSWIFKALREQQAASLLFMLLLCLLAKRNYFLVVLLRKTEACKPRKAFISHIA